MKRKLRVFIAIILSLTCILTPSAEELLIEYAAGSWEQVQEIAGEEEIENLEFVIEESYPEVEAAEETVSEIAEIYDISGENTTENIVENIEETTTENAAENIKETTVENTAENIIESTTENTAENIGESIAENMAEEPEFLIETLIETEVCTEESDMVEESELAALTVPSGAISMGRGFYCWESGGTLYITGRGTMPTYSTVTEIPWWGWSFSSVVIDEGVTSICSNAFYANNNICSLSLPSTLNTIGESAFLSCNISSVSVSASNSYLCSENGVLYNKGMTRLIFCPKSKISSYTFPESVTVIGTQAMNGITLSSYTVPEGIVEIGYGAFSKGSSLKSITLPESLRTIGEKAFDYTGLTSLTIPAGVTSIGEGICSGCSSLEYISVDSGNAVFWDVDGVLYDREMTSLYQCPRYIAGTEYVIPDGIQAIGANAFDNCRELQTVSIPDSVIYIGNTAFNYCPALEKVKLPSALEYLGEKAFSSCGKLKKIDFTGSMPDIGEKAFQSVTAEATYPAGDESWADVIEHPENYQYGGTITWAEGPWWELENGVLTIFGDGDMAEFSGTGSAPWYEDAAAVTSIVIDPEVTLIGNYAFAGCSNAKTVSIGKDVSYIGTHVFDDCSSLSSIFVSSLNPYFVTIDGALMNSGKTRIIRYPAARNAKEYRLVNTVTSIDAYAFANCSSLERIYFPGNAPSMGTNMFRNNKLLAFYCPNETWTDEVLADYGAAEIEWIPDIIWSYENGVLTISAWHKELDEFTDETEVPWYKHKSSIRSVVIESGVEKVGDYAFRNFTGITSLTVENGLSVIGDYAFGNTSLTDFVLPKSVNSVGTRAFYACDNLIAACFSGAVPASWGTGVFDGCPANFGVYYLEGQTGWTKPTWNSSAGEEFLSGLWGGFCGENDGNNIEWRFWFSNQTLNMTGIGNTDNWTEEVPWSACIPYLEKVVIGEGITYIGTAAFKDCSALMAAEFPSSLKTIGSKAFMNSSLEELQLPENLVSIASGAFQKCGIIQEVIIPASVTEIGKEAFAECAYLERVLFEGPEGEGDVDFTIGDKAFFNCKKLLNARFERNAPTAFGTDVFAGCHPEKKDGATLDEKIGFVITFDVKKENWTVPYYNRDQENDKYKSESTTFSVWRDTWSFENSVSDFGIGLLSNNYYISESDLTRLLSNMRTTVAEGRRNKYKTSWIGSCYGMCSWVMLNQANVLGTANLGDGSKSLIEFDCTDRVKSAINYYHHQQGLPSIMLAKNVFLDVNQNLGWNQTAQLATLDGLIQQTQSGGPLVFIDFQYDNTCHAMIGYAVEEGEWSFSGYSDVYDRRIVIYDPTHPEPVQGEEFYLYYNDTTWCIPGYNCRSTDHTISGSGNNGKLNLVTNNTELINAVDFVTGAVSLNEQKVTADLLYWDERESAAVYILYWQNEDGNLTHWSTDPSQTGDIVDEEEQTEAYNGVIHIIPDATGVSAGKAIVLPEDIHNLRIKVMNDAADFSIVLGEYYGVIKTDSPCTIRISEDGSVSVEGEEPEKLVTYSISLTANDGHTSLPWHTVTVSGTDSSQITATLTEAGLGIIGDNLENIQITVKDDNGSQQMNVSSGEDSVLLKPDENNTDLPAIYEDPDGDGVYDTPAEEKHAYTAPVFTWSSDYKTAAAVFSCTDNGCKEKQVIQAAVSSKTVDSTCKTKGKVTYTAAAVFEGSTYTENKTVILALAGHAYGGWEITVIPSAVQTGKQVKTCKVCGIATDRTLEKLKPTITVNAESIPLKVGQSTKALKVTGLMYGDSVKSWKSSNKKIVKVSKKGKITAKKVGKATVTITLASGLKKEIKVTVQKGTVKTKKITGLSKKITMKKGTNTVLMPVLNPITSQQKITYKSSNKKVVSVTAKGKLTAKKTGSAKITVKSGSKKFTVKVKVKK